MNDVASPQTYGVLTGPSTFMIQRLLPGPIEKVWAYIADGELRAKWLAAGKLDMTVGSLVELIWRNDELTSPPGQRPQGFSEEHRIQSRVNEVDPPRKLSISWGSRGDVSFELAPKGDDVLLTVVHRRLPDRASLLMVGPGWHTHLGLLVARLTGAEPEPFWDSWSRLRAEYAERLPT